jgi:hypothetical protein
MLLLLFVLLLLLLLLLPPLYTTDSLTLKLIIRMMRVWSVNTPRVAHSFNRYFMLLLLLLLLLLSLLPLRSQLMHHWLA